MEKVIMLNRLLSMIREKRRKDISEFRNFFILSRRSSIRYNSLNDRKMKFGEKIVVEYFNFIVRHKKNSIKILYR